MLRSRRWLGCASRPGGRMSPARNPGLHGAAPTRPSFSIFQRSPWLRHSMRGRCRRTRRSSWIPVPSRISLLLQSKAHCLHDRPCGPCWREAICRLPKAKAAYSSLNLEPQSPHSRPLPLSHLLLQTVPLRSWPRLRHRSRHERPVGHGASDCLPTSSGTAADPRPAVQPSCAGISFSRITWPWSLR